MLSHANAPGFINAVDNDGANAFAFPAEMPYCSMYR